MLTIDCNSMCTYAGKQPSTQTDRQNIKITIKIKKLKEEAIARTHAHIQYTHTHTFKFYSTSFLVLFPFFAERLA